MKLTALSSIALFALSAFGVQLQSDPFYLSIVSDNSTVNGSHLVSCHEGALIQGLCFLPPSESGDKAFSTFYLNYTSKAHPNTGKLVFHNEAIGPHNRKEIIPQVLAFLYSPGSNVAGLVFGASNEIVPISFDSSDRMFISVPKVFAQGDPNNYNPVHLHRWHLCLYPFEGYEYTELIWQLGDGPLIYRDCQKAGVKRVFQS